MLRTPSSPDSGSITRPFWMTRSYRVWQPAKKGAARRSMSIDRFMGPSMSFHASQRPLLKVFKRARQHAGALQRREFCGALPRLLHGSGDTISYRPLRKAIAEHLGAALAFIANLPRLLSPQALSRHCIWSPDSSRSWRSRVANITMQILSISGGNAAHGKQYGVHGSANEK